MFFRPAHCYGCHLRRRRIRFAVAVLILLLVIAGLAQGHSRPVRTRPARTTTNSRPGTAPIRPVPRHSSSQLVSAAGQGLTWASFHGIQLPASSTAGPRHFRAALAYGFADTPAGALLAAINIAVRTAAQWGPAIFTPVIARQVTGPDTAALLHADVSSYTAMRAATHIRAGQPAGRGYAAEVAFRFEAWTPAAAVVDVVSAGPANDGSTVMAATRIEVLWQRGDWRVLAPPAGNWANSATTISSLTGYTAFPGQR
jgi:hypothetical protein